jgi:hypothetical protein
VGQDGRFLAAWLWPRDVNNTALYTAFMEQGQSTFGTPVFAEIDGGEGEDSDPINDTTRTFICGAWSSTRSCVSEFK